MLPGPDGASAMQESQTPHGSGVGPCTQLSERARMRALEVLPQPRGPLNREAWLIRPLRSACRSGSVTCSWPLTSANVAGRYLRYRASPAPEGASAMTPSSPVRAIRHRPWDGRESPAHPSEPAYPCCLPALGGLAGCTPRGGPRDSLVTPRTTLARPRQSVPTNLRHRGGQLTVSLPTEDSPSGLWRTLGKRVGGNPSRVRIPHPPPLPAARAPWPQALGRHGLGRGEGPGGPAGH